MIVSKENKSEIIIFKTSDNTVSIDVRFEGETMTWLLCLKNPVQQ